MFGVCLDCRERERVHTTMLCVFSNIIGGCGAELTRVNFYYDINKNRKRFKTGVMRCNSRCSDLMIMECGASWL